MGQPAMVGKGFVAWGSVGCREDGEAVGTISYIYAEQARDAGYCI